MNIPELLILKLLIDINIYNKYILYIDINNIKYINRELYSIYLALNNCIKTFNRSISLDELELSVTTEQTSDSSNGSRDAYKLLFEQIRSADVREDMLKALLDGVAQKFTLSQIALTAFEASEGRKTADDVTRLVEGLQTSPTHTLDAGSFVSDDLETLYDSTIKVPGLRWRLQALNHSLGSLRKGDFGFVMARPETGKTTFLASEVTFMAPQAAGDIVWFNNEEQGDKVMLRNYQAALGIPLEKLLTDIKGNAKKFKELTRGKIKIVDDAGITKQRVEAICKTLRPSLIIFDQIDKVKGFNADREDLVLGAIYQWARELAKIYGPVIGICQADGTAEGIKWLHMGHAANSKTAKQAEADWILGIGRTNDIGMEYIRHFHLSKNKLIGDKDTIPDMRHARMDVIIQPDLARYQDVAG